MRRTVKIRRVFDPGRLTDEIKAAGINVITVRASSPDPGGPAIYGVVLFDGTAAQVADVQTAIAAHVDMRVPSRTDVNAAALAKMEADVPEGRRS